MIKSTNRNAVLETLRRFLRHSADRQRTVVDATDASDGTARVFRRVTVRVRRRIVGVVVVIAVVR